MIADILRTQANEIATNGYKGWGNTMNNAADEIEKLREFIEIWAGDGALQTFESREKFRDEVKELLAPNAVLKRAE